MVLEGQHLLLLRHNQIEIAKQKITQRNKASGAQNTVHSSARFYSNIYVGYLQKKIASFQHEPILSECGHYHPP